MATIAVPIEGGACSTGGRITGIGQEYYGCAKYQCELNSAVL
jgi:hypothetical protein